MRLFNLKRRLLNVIALMLWLALPGVSAAIDLSTAAQRTLESNPQLQLYPYHVRALEGESLQAGLKPNPRLNVDLENAFGTGDSRFLSGSELTLSLSQVIELGGKPERRADVVNRKSAALQHDYAVKRLDVVAGMMRDYYDTLRLQYLSQWNQQRIEAEKVAVQVIERRARAGVVGQADVMRMQLRLTKSEARQAELTAQHTLALKVLSANWAASPDFTQVEGDLEQLPALPSETMLTAALKQTPDYLLAVAQTRINEARLSLAQAESKANVTVGAGVRRLEANDDTALVFSFSVPLQWQDRNQGNIATAQAQYQEKLANEELLMSQLEIALARIQSAMQNNLDQVQRLQTDLHPVAGSLLKEVQRGYQLGQYSVLQWVDAQAELFNIERELIEAQHAVHLQFLELERLSGTSLVTTNAPPAVHKE
ncbi:TolC family protein [Methylophaga sp. OBS4]|uniref:TolC family protein n=1 Tax=Methylophaga sp. OBS4 TaxID=2991935 RepID=UPI00224F0BEE|nr:TolC family protein [Methylophaga sp. OBS4]MCX4186301.1 TolC family protein [Methylophaga sp. OBS4]